MQCIRTQTNVDMRENIKKDMTPEVQLRIHLCALKAAHMYTYGSETCMPRSQDRKWIEISEVMFLRSELGVKLRDRMRSEAIWDLLETEYIPEETRQYKK
jgi:hypothetical protein